MTKYELTIVLPGDSTEAKKKKVSELVKKVIKTFKGKIKESDDWGEIKLAYDVKGNTSGNFLYFLIELNEDKVKSLKEKLKVEEEILRYLLIKKDN